MSEKLVRAVKELRKAMRLTQVMFAQAIGVQPVTIQRYENPKLGPPAKDFELMARLTDKAKNCGREDLVEIFSAQLPQSLTGSRGIPSPSGDNAEWHEKLSYILDNGDESDKIGIQRNLTWAKNDISARSGKRDTGS